MHFIFIFIFAIKAENFTDFILLVNLNIRLIKKKNIFGIPFVLLILKTSIGKEFYNIFTIYVIYYILYKDIYIYIIEI